MTTSIYLLDDAVALDWPSLPVDKGLELLVFKMTIKVTEELIAFLRRRGTRCAQAVLHDATYGDVISLADVIAVLLKTKSSHKCASTLVSQIAHQLEEQLMSKLVAKEIPHNSTGDQRFAMLYWQQVRNACAGQRILSVSTDKSRLGSKGIIAGALALPSNVAVWLPPQEHSS